VNIGKQRQAGLVSDFGEDFKTFLYSRPAEAADAAAIGLVEAGLENNGDVSFFPDFDKPFCDIEAAFGISIDEKYAMQLYDMDLYEAAGMIVEMMRNEERKRLTANNRKEDKQ
jgi:hypothetical protein